VRPLFDRKNRGNAALFFAARSPGRFVRPLFDRKTGEMLPFFLRRVRDGFALPAVLNL
jgi:hypothetical protein